MDPTAPSTKFSHTHTSARGYQWKVEEILHNPETSGPSRICENGAVTGYCAYRTLFGVCEQCNEYVSPYFHGTAKFSLILYIYLFDNDDRNVSLHIFAVTADYFSLHFQNYAYTSSFLSMWLCVFVSPTIKMCMLLPVCTKLGTWTHLNGVLHKSLPSVKCVCMCIPHIFAR
jgi:hypothetical protein